MKVTGLFIISGLLLVLVALVLLGGCGGNDDGGGVTPGQLPVIRVFSINPTDIAPGDSTLVSYAVDNADSVVLYPQNLLLLPVDSGQVYVHPSSPGNHILWAYNVQGVVSDTLVVTMTAASPVITEFALDEDTLVFGDSTVLRWKTVRTDSLVITGLGSVTPVDSGAMTIGPTSTTFYRAIAYNSIARDTATATVVVEVPREIVSVNGLYHRGQMGAGLLAPGMQFRINDSIGTSLRKPWLGLSLLEGDGSLGADSLQPATNGIVAPTYTFDGGLGHAVIRTIVNEIDTLDVYARASTIIPGDHGQGQYILFDDLYSMILTYNGQPAAVAEDQSFWINYADYETALGVVFMVWDNNHSGTAEATEEVRGVIFTGNYTGGAFQNGLAIGSTISAVRAAFGLEDTVVVDATPPPAEAHIYDALGLTFWTLQGDSVVFEIHAYEVSAPTVLKVRPEAGKSVVSGDMAGPYRRARLIHDVGR